MTTKVKYFFIGQNGGFKNVADLIRQVKAMVKYSRCKHYVVVSFHKPNDVMPTPKRMGEMEDSLQLAAIAISICVVTW